MEDRFKDLLEDEELVALRLEALASKKRKLEQKTDNSSDSVSALPINSIISSSASASESASNQIPIVQSDRNVYNNYAWRKQTQSSRRRGGAFPKNSQRSNLIVISPVSLNDNKDSEDKVPSLILPQHKWCNSGNEDSMSPKTLRRTGPTRFNRHGSDSESSDSDYDNSENDSGSNETVLQDEPPEHFSRLSPKKDTASDSVGKQRRLSFQNLENEIQSEAFEKTETTSVYNCLKNSSSSLDYTANKSDNFVSVQNLSDNRHEWNNAVGNDYSSYKQYNNSYSSELVESSEGFADKQNNCVMSNGEHHANETSSLIAQPSDTSMWQHSGVKANNSYYSRDISEVSKNTRNHGLNDRVSIDYSDKRQPYVVSSEVQVSENSWKQGEKIRMNNYFSRDSVYSKALSRNFSSNISSKEKLLSGDDLRFELKKRMQSTENCSEANDHKNTDPNNSWDRNKHRYSFEEDRRSEISCTNSYGTEQDRNSNFLRGRQDQGFNSDRDEHRVNLNRRHHRSLSQERSKPENSYSRDRNRNDYNFNSESGRYNRSSSLDRNKNEFHSNQGRSRTERSSSRSRHERSFSHGKNRHERSSSWDRRFECSSGKSKSKYETINDSLKHELDRSQERNKHDYRSSQERDKHETSVDRSTSDKGKHNRGRSRYNRRYSSDRKRYVRASSQDRSRHERWSRHNRSRSDRSSSSNSRYERSSSSDSRHERSYSRDRSRRGYSSSQERSRCKRSRSRSRKEKSLSQDKNRNDRSRSHHRNSHERSQSRGSRSERTPTRSRNRRERSSSPDRNKHEHNSNKSESGDEHKEIRNRHELSSKKTKNTYKRSSSLDKSKESVISCDDKSRNDKKIEKTSSKEPLTSERKGRLRSKSKEKYKGSERLVQKSSRISNSKYKDRYSRSRSSSTSSSSSSSSSNHSSRPKIRSVPSVIKTIQPKIFDADEKETFCEVKPGKNISGSQTDASSVSCKKDDYNKLSNVKCGRLDGDLKVASDNNKRVPVHMRLGALPRKRLIQMPKDVEAAFVNSSSSSEGENVNTKCKRQNIRIVTDVYGSKAGIDSEKKHLGKEKPVKRSPGYQDKSKRLKTHR